MTQITGQMLIGGGSIRGDTGTIRPYDPMLGENIEPAFGAGDATHVERASDRA